MMIVFQRDGKEISIVIMRKDSISAMIHFLVTQWLSKKYISRNTNSLSLHVIADAVSCIKPLSPLNTEICDRLH